MKETWINGHLCSFEEKVRIEKGPQLVTLECNKENLSDAVTMPHYRIGGRDALGRVICPERASPRRDFIADPGPPDLTLGKVSIGEDMICVDWRCKFKPWVWKIYQWDGERFVHKDEVEELVKARAIARQLFEEM